MKTILTSLLALASYALYANSFDPDTIIIRLSNGEEVMIVSENDNEVELLQQYDMNAILRDLQRDTTQEGSIYIEIQDQTGSRYDLEEENHDDLSLEEKLERLERKMERAGQQEYTAESSSESSSTSSRSYSHRSKGTSTTMMFDFGLNNYLNNGRFPDETNELYTVKPLVSWNIALGITNTTKIAGPLYLEWGGNINWYNFKFENDRTRMEKTDNGVVFFEDLDVRDPRKSKFVVPYLNAQFVPMFQFGKARRDGWFPLDRDDDSGFRIGMGGYAGYRVGSRHKYVIKQDNRIRVKPERTIS